MAILPQRFINAVVASGHLSANGGPQWFATGFLYGKRKAGQDPTAETGTYMGFLVSNRHVFEDIDTCVLSARRQEGGTPLLGSGGAPWWRGSPDPDIDVAIAAIDRSNVMSLCSPGSEAGVPKLHESPSSPTLHRHLTDTTTQDRLRSIELRI